MPATPGRAEYSGSRPAADRRNGDPDRGRAGLARGVAGGDGDDVLAQAELVGAPRQPGAGAEQTVAVRRPLHRGAVEDTLLDVVRLGGERNSLRSTGFLPTKAGVDLVL